MVKLIGLCGGIGSGKSTVARGVASMGYPVYYTDTEALRLIAEDTAVQAAIVDMFGEEAYKDGLYDRSYMSAQVFGHPERLAALNAIVHPAVRRDLQAWKERQQGLCFVESAILFESHLDELCEATVAVCADRETRIRRTMLRDGASREQVVARLAHQMTDDNRRRLSTFSIDNDGTTPVADLCRMIIRLMNNHY